GRSAGIGAGRQRLRSALVSAEVAVTLMLLVGAALLIQSFARLQRVDPGFQPAQVATMELQLPRSTYPEDHHRAEFFDRLLERITIVPGFESVGMTVLVPFGGAGYNFGIRVEGREKDPSGKIYTADWRPVTPNYFRAIGVPLAKGRMFTAQDNESSQKVILVNESFARSFLQ